MEDQDQRELQLLPTPQPTPSSSLIPPWPSSEPSIKSRSSEGGPPSLDLQLSISLKPIRPPPSYGHTQPRPGPGHVEALKWQASEQIRLAAMEKAYAERVRELTRREMEIAHSEFARARHVWERAREEVEKAERMKERATRRVDPTCMEITCQSCRQIFRP